MAEDLLDRADVVSGLEVRRERVADPVAVYVRVTSAAPPAGRTSSISPMSTTLIGQLRVAETALAVAQVGT